MWQLFSRSLVPLMLLGSLQGSVQESSVGRAVRVSSETESYFSVRVPRSAPDLYIYAESKRGPVQLAVAMGYFPKESHFDTSNFAAWAKGLHNSQVHVPLSALRSPPRCDGAEGVLEKCLSRASSGLGLQCGSEAEAVPVDGGDSRAQPCPKHVGQCAAGMCESHLQGPTVCNISNIWSGKGDCNCQQGFCATPGGLCADADSVQVGCAKVAGRSCSFYACDPEYGAANCEDGMCVCAPGHCAVRGVCQPGPLCKELSHQAICEASIPQTGPFIPDMAMEGVSRLPSPAIPADPADSACCDLMNAARKRDPGRFARCVAGYFFSVDGARSRGTEAPLLADLSPPSFDASDVDELIVMARSCGADHGPLAQKAHALKAQADSDAATSDEVYFYFNLFGNRSGLAGLSPAMAESDWPPLTLQPLQHFRTLEELISPSRSATGSLQATLEQQEVPLLRPAAIPELGASGTPSHSLLQQPYSSMALKLRQNELMLLHLGEAHQAAALADGLRGDLHLHLRGLPDGTSVLYSRAFPAPRSLMDFGHAKLVEGIGAPMQEIQVSNNETVWQARGHGSQYFAVLSPVDCESAAYFTVQPSSSDVALASAAAVEFSGPVPKIPYSTATVASPNSIPEDNLGADTHWFALIWFGLTVVISCLAFCRWALPQRERGPDTERIFDTQQLFDTLSETPRLLFNAPRLYMPVMGSEQEASETAPTGVHNADSDDDGGQACPKAPSFSSLKVFGLAVAKRLAAARKFGSRSSRHSDGDDSDDYEDPRSLHLKSMAHDRGGTEEARGLLSCEPEDECELPDVGARGRSQSPVSRGRCRDPARSPQSPLDSLRADDREAMDALMKLRPAARDSVGDDTLEDTDGPLMGTNRSAMLSRGGLSDRGLSDRGLSDSKLQE